MERLPALRASDSDREQVAERLRRATGEGRLSADELEERLDALFSARTYGELDALVADLPVSRPETKPRAQVARWAAAVGAVAAMLAILGTLAVTRVHSATGVAGNGRFGRFRVPGLFGYPQHRAIVAPAAVAVVAVLLVAAALCAALFWGLTQSRHTSNR